MEVVASRPRGPQRHWDLLAGSRSPAGRHTARRGARGQGPHLFHRLRPPGHGSVAFQRSVGARPHRGRCPRSAWLGPLGGCPVGEGALQAQRLIQIASRGTFGSQCLSILAAVVLGRSLGQGVPSFLTSDLMCFVINCGSGHSFGFSGAWLVSGPKSPLQVAKEPDTCG